jgi:hypothetical protein
MALSGVGQSLLREGDPQVSYVAGVGGGGRLFLRRGRRPYPHRPRARLAGPTRTT